MAEYLNFEQVHLYTYDIMAERVGFKLGWGCLAWSRVGYASTSNGDRRDGLPARVRP